MSSRLVRIGPWSAAKICALGYFLMGLVFAVILALAEALTEPAPGEEELGIGFIVFFPILYALIGLIFAPFGAWLYNVVAGLVGGLEVKLENSGS